MLKCVRDLSIFGMVLLIYGCATPTAVYDPSGELTHRTNSILDKSSFQAVRLSYSSKSAKLGFSTFDQGRVYEFSRYVQIVPEGRKPIVFNIVWQNVLSSSEIKNPNSLGDSNGAATAAGLLVNLIQIGGTGATFGIVVDENLCVTKNWAQRENRFDRTAAPRAQVNRGSNITPNTCFDILER